MKLKHIFFILLFCLPSVGFCEDATTSRLMKQIDYLQSRHEVLAENVANVSTPKYKAQDLERPDALNPQEHKVRVPKIKMKITNSRHLRGEKKGTKYSLLLDKTSPEKPNKNNVDIAKQVTNIAQNSDEVSLALKNYRSAMDLINTASGGQ